MLITRHVSWLRFILHFRTRNKFVNFIQALKLCQLVFSISFKEKVGFG